MIQIQAYELQARSHPKALSPYDPHPLEPMERETRFHAAPMKENQESPCVQELIVTKVLARIET